MGFPRGFCLLVVVFFCLVWGFPGGAVVKNPPANAGDTRCRFYPWVRKILWRRARQPTAVFLPGESAWTEEPGGLLSMGSQSDATEHTADTVHPRVSLWPAALWTASRALNIGIGNRDADTTPGTCYWICLHTCWDPVLDVSGGWGHFQHLTGRVQTGVPRFSSPSLSSSAPCPDRQTDRHTHTHTRTHTHTHTHTPAPQGMATV